MSNVTTTTNTNNQLANNYDYSKIFLFGNKYEKGDFTNASGSEVTLEAGTLIGRIASTNLLVVCKSAATDGSQYPIGVLAETIIVPDTETRELPICVAGEVAEEKIIFDGSDSFDTVVESKTLRDRIGADSVGVKLVPSTPMTKFDN